MSTEIRVGYVPDATAWVLRDDGVCLSLTCDLLRVNSILTTRSNFRRDPSGRPHTVAPEAFPADEPVYPAHTAETHYLVDGDASAVAMFRRRAAQLGVEVAS